MSYDQSQYVLLALYSCVLGQGLTGKDAGFAPPPPLQARWLYTTALMCVQSVQVGEYRLQSGLEWVKMGSKWALWCCFSTRSGWKSFLESPMVDLWLICFS